MKLELFPCPCGCGKFVIKPLFNCLCSTLNKTDAEELVRRWNAFEEAPPACVKCGRTEDHHAPMWFCDGFEAPVY